jgi:hypothetical protein
MVSLRHRPNFANEKAGIDLSPQELDYLFCAQLGSANPKRLETSTLTLCGIGNAPSLSERTMKRLVELGIIGKDDGSLHTDKIDKRFANKLSFIPVGQQKKLINLLFTWEEELMRWRLLEEEEEEIKTVMKAGTATDGTAIADLEMRLKQIDSLKKLKPSLRSKDPQQDQLPGYQAK